MIQSPQFKETFAVSSSLTPEEAKKPRRRGGVRRNEWGRRSTRNHAMSQSTYKSDNVTSNGFGVCGSRGDFNSRSLRERPEPIRQRIASDRYINEDSGSYTMPSEKCAMPQYETVSSFRRYQYGNGVVEQEETTLRYPKNLPPNITIKIVHMVSSTPGQSDVNMGNAQYQQQQ